MTRLICFLAMFLVTISPALAGMNPGHKGTGFFDINSFAQQETEAAEQEDEATEGEDEEAEEEKIETVEIEAKPIRVFKNLDGVFESGSTYEIETDFDAWTDLEVKEIVEQGAKVKKGDTLVEFDTEDLEEAIRDAEFDLINAQLDMDEAELKKKQLDKTWEMDKKAAERDWKQAQEDNDYYWEVEVPQRDKDLEFDMETAGYSLEYNKDELDQLEKMYTEDELTEESEEIVLKRARRSVKSSEWYFEMTKERLRYRKEVSHPREDEETKVEFERAEMAHARTMIELEGSKKRSEIEFERATIALKEAKEKHEELAADLKKMELKAPAGGVVFFGSCDRGEWSDNDIVEIGDSMSEDSVVMTIVKTDGMTIRSSVEEEDLSMIAEKLSGTGMIPAFGRDTVGVKVKSVSTIPMSDGGYDCVIDITGDEPSKLLPGMSCKMSFMAYENKKALVAPADSVFSDDDGITHYVFVVEDEEAKRVDVKVGETSDDNIEIVDGLKKGDTIAVEKQ